MGDAPIPFPGARSVGIARPGLWHVNLVVGGPSLPPDVVSTAMHRLSDPSPFLASIRYDARHAQISYWDEGDVLDDVAAMALRLWHDNRREADLPQWGPMGLTVLDRESYLMSG